MQDFPFWKLAKTSARQKLIEDGTDKIHILYGLGGCTTIFGCPITRSWCCRNNFELPIRMQKNMVWMDPFSCMREQFEAYLNHN